MKTGRDTGTITPNQDNLQLKSAKYLPVIIVLTAGIIIGCLSFKNMADYENNKIQLELQRSAENRIMALQRGFEASCLVL